VRNRGFCCSYEVSVVCGGGRVCGSCGEWVGGEFMSREQTPPLRVHAKANPAQMIINLNSTSC